MLQFSQLFFHLKPETKFGQSASDINFSNFTSKPFNYLLISWMSNFAHNHRFLTCLSNWLYWSRMIHTLKTLQLKFWLKFIIFHSLIYNYWKYLTILLDVLFHEFRFSKASLMLLRLHSGCQLNAGSGARARGWGWGLSFFQRMLF